MQKNLQDFIAGLTILSKYSDDEHFEMCSQYDMISFAPDVSENLPSEEDRKLLDAYGFFYSKDCGSWSYWT